MMKYIWKNAFTEAFFIFLGLTLFNLFGISAYWLLWPEAGPLYTIVISGLTVIAFFVLVGAKYSTYLKKTKALSKKANLDFEMAAKIVCVLRHYLSLKDIYQMDELDLKYLREDILKWENEGKL